MVMLRQNGVTYLVVLLIILAMEAAAGATAQVWHTVQQREKERELLFIGNQFRQAIALYYERSTGPVKHYPMALEDLLADKRFVNSPRYLRKLFYDPMLRKKKWGLVEAPEGGIMGVHSLSDEVPLKTSGFSLADTAFEGKGKYSEWEFVYVPVNH